MGLKSQCLGFIHKQGRFGFAAFGGHAVGNYDVLETDFLSNVIVLDYNRNVSMGYNGKLTVRTFGKFIPGNIIDEQYARPNKVLSPLASLRNTRSRQTHCVCL